MSRRTTIGMAATAVLGLASAGLAGPATAGGDGHHDGHDGPAVTLRLTDRTVDRLTAGPNGIKAVGKADKHTDDGDVWLSLPLRRTEHQRGGDDGDHDGRAVALAGAIAYTGAGPDVRWTGLRVNLGKGRITAKLNGGTRAVILTIDRRDDDRHHRGGSRDATRLRLTEAGARSLNVAAAGTPFRAGDAYAGDSDGCR